MTKLAACLILTQCLLAGAWAQPGTGAVPLTDTIDEGAGSPVFFYVNWPEHDVSRVVVRVSLDVAGNHVVTSSQAKAGTGATFCVLDPGAYYLTAFIDSDGNGRASAGDGVGFYGVTDSGCGPVPLLVDAGSGPIEVSISIVFQLDDQRRLKPSDATPSLAIRVKEEVPVTGTATGGKGEVLVVLTPLLATYPPKVVVAGADGSFSLTAVPGAYQLVAFEQANQSGGLAPGDPIGVGGITTTDAASLPLIKIEAGKPIEGLQAPLLWVLDGEGRLRTPDGVERGPALNPARLPGIVSGIVTRDGAPVAGAVVWVCTGPNADPLHSVATTDANGRYRIGLLGGSYYLVAWLAPAGQEVIYPGAPMGRPASIAPAADGKPGSLLVRAGAIIAPMDIALTETYTPPPAPPVVGPTPPPPAAGPAAP